mgnify:CR=1 FL=1
MAHAYKELFSRAGLESFAKTSGGTGLHLYVPAGKKYHYEQIRALGHDMSVLVHQALPKLTTLERSLGKRGTKIYLDYLQNSKGQTIAGVYCLRPRPGAPVSMPVHWREVKPGLDPRSFHIHNVLPRIKKIAPLFTGIFGKGFDLKKTRKILGIESIDQTDRDRLNKLL